MEKSSRRILVLLTGLFDSPGGIQTYNRSLVKALDELAEEKKIPVTILVLNDRADSNANHYFHSKYLNYYCFNHQRLRFMFRALFEAIHASVVLLGHVRFAPLTFFLRLFSKHSKKLLAIYGAEAWKPLPLLQRWSLSQIHTIISISEITQKEFISQNKTCRANFKILAPSLDPLYASSSQIKTREALLLPRGEMILTVSRLDGSEAPKKIDSVIKSLPVILQSLPEAFYVVVGGAHDGSDLERLKKLSSDLEVEDKIYFVGEVSDKERPSYYEACDVFVLPSVKEGFGIVFLEGMYHQKPCVGALAGGVPEIIEDKKTGFLINPDSIEDLTRVLLTLLQSKSLQQEIGKAACKRAEEQFSFKKFQERLEKILSESLKAT